MFIPEICSCTNEFKLATAFLYVVKCNLDLFLEYVRADEKQWDRRQAKQCQPPILIEHECEDED
jgi:hypothetical protein